MSNFKVRGILSDRPAQQQQKDSYLSCPPLSPTVQTTGAKNRIRHTELSKNRSQTSSGVCLTRGLVAFREIHYEGMSIGLSGSLFDLILSGRWKAVGNIFRYRFIEQGRFLAAERKAKALVSKF